MTTHFFKNNLCCSNLWKSLFEISEGQAGNGFGAFAFNKMYRVSVFNNDKIDLSFRTDISRN